jgi:alkanesulfonate monooxygenase SsuD/methylene tetrahydromethanopterin reductase-like flavin-dependent oxidoreductase (luciferase family)
VKLSAYLFPVRFPEFIESVKAAERNGYERAWVPDSQMIWEDVYVYMTSALAATDRIVVGSGVTQPVTRHFTVSASGHATLAKIHPGRVVLGLGRGDSAVRTLGLKPMLTKPFAELIPRVRELTRGNDIDFDGTAVRLTWCEGDPLPIMVAATGPRNLRTAGAFADIVQLQVGAHPAAVRWAVQAVREGAEEAGRDPSEVEISILCGMWVTDDKEEAYREARWAPACAANHISDVAKYNPDAGMPEELLEVIRRRDQHYDYYGGHCENDSDHADYVTPDLIDNFGIVGTREECLERIEVLAAEGVDEIAAGFLNGSIEQMDRVGREIMPELAGVVSGAS